MNKDAVYSWRLPAWQREALEERARRQGLSLSAVLDHLAGEWLARDSVNRDDEAAEQARLQAAAGVWLGSIRGGDPGRASQARQRVRERLRRGR